jgi:hypothetical protein
MADTLALSDNQRTLIGIAFTILLTLNVSLAGLAAANQIAVPTFVYFALAIAAVVIQAIKDKLGVRDATTAAVAKEANTALVQHREPSREQLPKAASGNV